MFQHELVSYYYFWKKTNDGFKPKNPNRAKPYISATKRTTRNGTATPTFNEQNLIDYDSLSESEDSEESRNCHHCYTSGEPEG